MTEVPTIIAVQAAAMTVLRSGKTLYPGMVYYLRMLRCIVMTEVLIFLVKLRVGIFVLGYTPICQKRC